MIGYVYTNRKHTIHDVQCVSCMILGSVWWRNEQSITWWIRTYLVGLPIGWLPELRWHWMESIEFRRNGSISVDELRHLCPVLFLWVARCVCVSVCESERECVCVRAACECVSVRMYYHESVIHVLWSVWAQWERVCNIRHDEQEKVTAQCVCVCVCVCVSRFW